MSLPESALLASVVQCVMRLHDGQATPADHFVLEQVGLERLQGGFNNTVYALYLEGRGYCIKFYREDNRLRAQREWNALQTLSALGNPYPPHPYTYSAAHRPPVIVMERVEGRSLGGQRLSQEVLVELADALRTFTRITPEVAHIGEWPVLAYAQLRLHGLRALEREMAALELNAAGREALALLRGWLGSSEPVSLLEADVLAFSPGDANLANCLWDGRRLRMVDFEYSGWGDRTFALADWIEHVQSRGTADEDWDWFAEQFVRSNAERLRLLAARRLISLFWVAKLWSLARTGSAEGAPDNAHDWGEQETDPYQRLAQQIERARRLGVG